MPTAFVSGPIGGAFQARARSEGPNSAGIGREKATPQATNWGIATSPQAVCWSIGYRRFDGVEIGWKGAYKSDTQDKKEDWLCTGSRRAVMGCSGFSKPAGAAAKVSECDQRSPRGRLELPSSNIQRNDDFYQLSCVPMDIMDKSP